jgi:multiple sugar transport system permease protein
MALIPTVGRKSWSLRILIAGLYIVLSIGAVTMIYPFLLMLSTSVTSGVDVNRFQVIPAYLYDSGTLFSKYAEDKYLGDIIVINDTYCTDFAKLEDVTPPANISNAGKLKAMAKDWQQFVATLPLDFKQVGFTGYMGSPSKTLNLYRKWVAEKYDTTYRSSIKLTWKRMRPSNR